MRRPPARTLPASQRGVGIVETMVGILIGLVVVVVVYNMLAVAESYKRGAIGTADAQITGLISQFMAGQDIANGGNGLSSGYNDLVNCTKNEDGSSPTWDTSLKPIPILITPGATAERPDSFLSRQGGSPHVVWPVAFRPVDATGDTVSAGGDIQVQSPNGFMTPGKASMPTGTTPFWAVTIANDGTGRCGLISITNAAAASAPPMDDSGEVKLTQGNPKTTIDYKGVAQNSLGTGAVLLNLGRRGAAGGATRVLYEIDPPIPDSSRKSQLRVTNCMFAGGCSDASATANPVAENVVWMKAQYGIDTGAVNANGTLRGRLDCWTKADDQTPGCMIPGVTTWAPSTLLNAGEGGIPANVLNRIVAVRIGFVVRSDEPDFRNPALFRTTAVTVDGAAGTRGNEYLFNCPANTDAGCPNRVLIPAGADGSGKIMEDGWRYRVYETVIPLRNSLFTGTAVQ